MKNDETKSSYGYCPICGSSCLERERRYNGNDVCEKSHTYPSRDSIDSDKAMKIKVLNRLTLNDGKLLDQLIERLGEDPEDWVD